MWTARLSLQRDIETGSWSSQEGSTILCLSGYANICYSTQQQWKFTITGWVNLCWYVTCYHLIIFFKVFDYSTVCSVESQQIIAETLIITAICMAVPAKSSLNASELSRESLYLLTSLNTTDMLLPPTELWKSWSMRETLIYDSFKCKQCSDQKKKKAFRELPLHLHLAIVFLVACAFIFPMLQGPQ